MPNITVIRSQLFAALRKGREGEREGGREGEREREFSDEEFDELCFEFGVEVDDIITQTIEYVSEGLVTHEDHVVYVIAIPANRYDLLSFEGFARALRIFLGYEISPTFQKISSLSSSSNLSLSSSLSLNNKREVVIVESSTASIRPYCVAAILRNITFNSQKYKNFIDLQDKLHQNICRKRTYVAIGTHDYDTIQGPFYYRALSPSNINFVPLTENNGKSYNSKELLDFYRENPLVKHLKPYTDIIYDSPVYPVVTDSNDTVLSLPPIINSYHSRITLQTKNVFIECTATDLTKANIVLDTIVTMFSEYCEVPFTVEEVEIQYEPGPATTPSGEPLLIPVSRHQITPLLSTRQCVTSCIEINQTIGIELTGQEMCTLCNRMQLGPAVYDENSQTITVTIPPTRSDILHPVDVIEDIAIAYGYNRIPIHLPKTLTVGEPLPINLFTDLLRHEVSRAGYMEMLTHGLCSIHENFTALNHPIGPAVSLANPANIEYEVVRTTLLPGALKTLAHNKSISHKDGIKLFEINDIVLPTTQNEIGSENIRKFVGLYAAPTSALEIIHGLIDRIFRSVQIIPLESYGLTSLTSEEYEKLKRIGKSNVCYYLRANEDPLYFPGMGADVILTKRVKNNESGETEEKDIVIGTMGVIHPKVLDNFEISYPCSVVELDIESIM